MENQNIEKTCLLEQYKSYMENLNQIGNQHSQTRAFYVSIISALLVFLSFISSKDVAMIKTSISGQIAVLLLGIILCIAWFIHTRSYAKLFKAKFSILREIEQGLSFQIFEKEWNKLTEFKYNSFMKIESYVAIAIGLLFIMLLTINVAFFLSP